MDRQEFQTLAVRTESVKEAIELRPDDRQVFLDALEHIDTLCEVLDLYKKHIFYGRDLDYGKMRHFVQNALRGLTLMNFDVGDLELADRLEKDRADPEALDINARVFHALLGTITEHGELSAALYKGLTDEDGPGLDYINVLEELGDSDWYKALFYEATGVDWETVQATIIKKLEIRFKDKIFGEDGANDRDLEAERAELERLLQAQLDLFEG